MAEATQEMASMTDETTQALLPCPPCPICRADATWETALTANVGGKEVIYGSCSECSCTAEYHDWLAHSRPSQASDAGEIVEALRLADALLRGANMDRIFVERKVSEALAKVGGA